MVFQLHTAAQSNLLAADPDQRIRNQRRQLLGSGLRLGICHPKPNGLAEHSTVFFQWYFNSTRLPNQTSSQLTLTNVSGINEGNYWVLVYDWEYAIQSRMASLSIPRYFSNGISIAHGCPIKPPRS